ncbi:hypothetical protein BJ165DRAFT_1533206 [Panaeolus papilionaceus]|nr:hypothetical protein BJ165DRAFT_1533206 [Panaeolus papilionaceus]
MSSSSQRSIIDDTDPRIAYSATTWTIHGSDLSHRNSAHRTNTAGATATFRFNGTSVEVFGNVGKVSSKRTPISTYTLEDGSSASFKPVETSQDQYNVLFFRKQGLGLGEHVLVIKNLVEDDAFWLDYLTVDSDSSGVAVGNATPSLSTGVIVGAALGSLFVTVTILLLGFFLWTCIRERRQNMKPTARHTYSPLHAREVSRHPVIRPPTSSYHRPQSSSRVSTPLPSRTATPPIHPTITPYNLASRDPDPPTWTRPHWSFSHSSTSLPISNQYPKATNSSNTSLPQTTRAQGSASNRHAPSSTPVIQHSRQDSVVAQTFPPPYTTSWGHDGS